MTGSITGVHPVQAAVLYSFRHALQDLSTWTEGLTAEQLWRQMGDVAPVGFHALHLAGSVERLLTYATGNQLSESQMEELRAEKGQHNLSREELLQVIERKLQAAEAVVRSLDLSDLNAVREIGRKRIPSPLGVLLVHIAEHTQRHVGEAIVTAKLARK
jgi:uncharacterized damage-inducible protein DinB